MNLNKLSENQKNEQVPMKLPENSTHSILSMWIVTEKQEITKLELKYTGKIQKNQIAEFKTDVSYKKQLTENIYLLKANFLIPDNSLVLFTGSENYFWYRWDFRYGPDQEGENNYQKFNNFEFSFNFKEPSIVFLLKNNLSESDHPELGALMANSIKAIIKSNEERHLISFFSNFWIYRKNRKIYEIEILKKILSSMSEQSDEYLKYSFLTTAFFKLDYPKNINLLLEIFEKKTNLVIDVFALIFNYYPHLGEKYGKELMEFLAHLIIKLGPTDDETRIFQRLVEKYKGPFKNDLFKSKFEHFCHEVCRTFYIQKSPELNLSWNEIVILINYSNPPDKDLLKCIKTIDMCFEFIEKPDSIKLELDFFKEFRRHFINFLDESKFGKLSDEQLKRFFEGAARLNQEKFDFFFPDEYNKTENEDQFHIFGYSFKSLPKGDEIGEKIGKLMHRIFSNDQLFDSLSQHCGKFLNCLNRRLMSKIIQNKDCNKSNILIRLFKFAFHRPEFKNCLSSDLYELEKIDPNLILQNLNEIHNICKNDKEILRIIFSKILKLSFANFTEEILKQKLNDFKSTVSNDDIFYDVIESMIDHRMKGQGWIKYSRFNVFQEILTKAQKNKRRGDGDLFNNYILTKGHIHVEIDDKEAVIKSILENNDDSKITLIIHILQTPKSLENQAINELLEKLETRIKSIASGEEKTSKFDQFCRHYRSNENLQRMCSLKQYCESDFLLLKTFEIEKIELEHKRQIIKRWCSKCSDYERMINETTFTRTDIENKSVKEFVIYSNEFLKEIDWNLLLITLKGIDLGEYRLNIADANNMTSENLLKAISEKLNSLKSKIGNLKREYSNMSLKEIKLFLKKSDEKELLKLIEIYFTDMSDKNEVYPIINLSINFSSVLNYFKFCQNILTNLGLSIQFSEEQNRLIQFCNSFDSQNSLMKDFIRVYDGLGMHFDHFSLIVHLTSKFEFLKNFNQFSELMENILKRMRVLKELSTDLKNEEDITWDNLNDLEIISNFLGEFKTNLTGNQQEIILFKNLKHFDNTYEKLKEKKEFVEIDAKIKYFCSNYQLFYNFYKRSESAFESMRELISQLMKDSSFKIEISKDKMLIRIKIHHKNYQNPKVYSLSELEEMKDSLSKKISFDQNQENPDNPNDQLDSPRQIVEKFESMFEILSKLNLLIFQLKENGFSFSTFGFPFQIKDGVHEKLDNYVKGLEEYKDHVLREIHSAYEENFLFTFLYGDFIPQFIDILKIDNPTTKDLHLLKHMGFRNFDAAKQIDRMDIESIRNSITGAETELSNDHSMVPVLNQLLKDDLYGSNDFNQANSLEFESQFSTTHYYHVDVPLVSGQSYLHRSILVISLTVNKRLPEQRNILFCDSKTSSAKLTAFVNRVFVCQNNELFMIVQPELLLHSLQQELIKLMVKHDKRKRKTLLFVLYLDRRSSFVTFLMENQNQKAYKLKDTDCKSFPVGLEELKSGVTMVTGEKSSIGKSSWINDEIATKYQQPNLCYLRVTGVVDFELILAYLMDKLKTSDAVLHIDVGPVNRDSLRLLDQLLFSLVFLKSLEIPDRVVVIPEGTRFYMEFDHSITQSQQSSIEFFCFEFESKHFKNNDPVHFVPITPIPVLFVHLLGKRDLGTFNLEYLQNKLIIPKDENELRMAESNVGLNRMSHKIVFKEQPIRNQTGFFAFFFARKEFSIEEMETKYQEFMRGHLSNNSTRAHLSRQLIFQKVIHSLAYHYCKNKIFNDCHAEIGELIVKSAAFMSHEFSDSLISIQSHHKELYRHNKTNDTDTYEEEKKKEITGWKNKNTILISFNDGLLLVVYSNKELVPKKILNQKNLPVTFYDIKNDKIHTANKESTESVLSNEDLFFQLSQLNNKLILSRLCVKCSRVFPEKSCIVCENKCVSANEFWSSNQSNEAVKIVIQNIPLSNGIRTVTERHKIEAFRLYLKTTFGNEIPSQLKVESGSDLVCLFCKQIRAVVVECSDCKSELVTAESHYENEKDGEEFQKIHRRNQEEKRLKPPDAPNQRVYCIFEQDKNVVFVNLVSKTLSRDYVLTSDNFSKILQIHFRAKARLPIVVMGETGCGKTSLIRFLCRFVLDDYFEVFNMHAGISESDIEARVTAFINTCDLYPTTDRWLLFDEFNTSDANGLIKTLMVDRIFKNEKVPVNAIFVATCNPFKLKKKDLITKQVFGLKRIRGADHFSLTYHVHPIPESLLNYTLDFGQLPQTDEMKYIEAILKRSIDGISNGELRQMASVCYSAHRVLKQEGDLSATSLRDIKRFVTVFNFFKTKYFAVLNSLGENQHPAPIKEKALVLSVMMCYGLRENAEKRSKILEGIQKYAGTAEEETRRIFEEESSRLLSRFCSDSSKEVIQNTALRENIFSMFVCLLNKIPLIIVGKAGSSKSLALDLIERKMSGQNSSDEFFKKFERLAFICYQGSEFSSSETIENTIEKARGLLIRKNVESRTIPVFVFDEIGLAELNEKNPLKTLHSVLEVENVKVGFVGISNWHLDSSKMNRMLTVLRADPTSEECCDTAHKIIHQIMENRVNPQLLNSIRDLSRAYSDEISKTRSGPQERRFFIGLRDFYQLVKMIAQSYVANGPQSLSPSLEEVSNAFYRASVMSIRRNFNFHEQFSSRLCKTVADSLEIDAPNRKLMEESDISKLMVDNLTDVKSRPLLIITDSHEVHNSIYSLLSNQHTQRNTRNYKVLIGSHFEKDCNSEGYCIEVVSQIIHCMNNPMTLVLHDLEIVHTSLYDLLNQSFKNSGGKKFCRIVQGTHSKRFYPVHEHFKIVLFLNYEQLERSDEPFINRFEKYSFEFKDLTNVSDKSKIEKLTELFNNTLNTRNENVEEMQKLRKVILGNLPQSSSFLKWTKLIDEDKRFNNDQSDYNSSDLLKVLKNISSLYFTKVIFNNNEIEHRSEILREFLENKSKNLIDLFRQVREKQKREKQKFTLNIIYTFSNILNNVKKMILSTFNSGINFQTNQTRQRSEEDVDFLNQFSFEELVLSTVKSDKVFKELVQSFLSPSNETRLMIIKIDSSNEIKHMFYLQNTILSMVKEYKGSSVKHFMLVIYYKPSDYLTTENYQVSSEWTETFVDDLFHSLNANSVSIFTSPHFSSAVKLLRNRVVSEFDSMVDKSVQVRHTVGLNHNDLTEYLQFFRNFTEQYGEDVRDVLINKIMDIIAEDKSTESKKTIYDVMDEDSDITGVSQTFIQKVDSLIIRKFETKLSALIQLMMERKVPECLRFCIQNKMEIQKQKMVRMIIDIIDEQEINQPIPWDFSFPEVDLLVPFSPIEYYNLSFILNGNENLDRDELFEKYLSVSFYRKKGFDIQLRDSSIVVFIVIDLIRLHLCENTSKSLSKTNMLILFEQFGKSEIFALDIFKVFIKDTLLLSNLFLLGNHILDLLEIKSTFDLEIVFQPNAYPRLDDNLPIEQRLISNFKLLIEKLSEGYLNPQTVLSHLTKSNEKYREVHNLLEIVEKDSQLTLNYFSCFNLLFYTGDIICKLSPQDSFIGKIITGRPELLYNMDIDNFLDTMAQFRFIGLNCFKSESIQERLLDFEVSYFEKQIEVYEKIKDFEKTKSIFEMVFNQIEKREEFANKTTKIIKKFTDMNDFKKYVSGYIEHLKTNEKNLDPPQIDATFKDLSEKFPKRLPSMLISAIIPIINELFSKRELTDQRTIVENVLKKLRRFLNKQMSLKDTGIVLLSFIKFFVDELSLNLMGKKATDPDIDAKLNNFLNEECELSETLRIYLFKILTKNNFLDQVLSQSKEEWTGITRDQIKDNPNENSDTFFNCCSFKTDENHAKLKTIFIDALKDEKYDPSISILDYLRVCRDSKSLLAFYSFIINVFYSKTNRFSQTKSKFADQLNNSKNGYIEILGKEGYEFVCKVLSNFNNKSHFHIDSNSGLDFIKRNTCILFAFASILSHRNNNNYFTSLAFLKSEGFKTIFDQLKESYLPGVNFRIPSEINIMRSLLDYVRNNWQNNQNYQVYQRMKRIWKCSRDCDYFFVFGDCGQPEVQPKRVFCPICKIREIGAQHSHQAFPHHFPYTREEGEECMNNKINAFFKSYPKGYPSSEPQLERNDQKELHCSFITANILNFMTNSLILVLNDLNPSGSIDSLVGLKNKSVQFLVERISTNLKELKRDFPRCEPEILMNLFTSKISSEVNETKPMITPTDYLKFEKELETDLLNPIIVNWEVFYYEYRLQLHQMNPLYGRSESPYLYLNEANTENPPVRPLLFHLKIQNPPLSLKELTDRIDRVRGIEDSYPLTHYVLNNFENLKHLQVILKFKNFYEEFRNKHNEKLDREYVKKQTISSNFLKKDNPNLLKKLESFVQSWNEFAKQKPSMRLECQEFSFSEFSKSANFTQYIPNKRKDELGMMVIYGINQIMKHQNNMLNKMTPPPDTKRYSWKHVRERSLFKFDEKDMTDLINEECVTNLLDYGRNGSRKLDFGKLEGILTREISSLRMFSLEDDWIPHFNYQHEIEDLREQLSLLRDSGHQTVLDGDDRNKITRVLRDLKSEMQQCPCAELLNFCKNHLLKRAALIARLDKEIRIKDFIEKQISRTVLEGLTTLNCFDDLKISKLFDFYLLIEILYFNEHSGHFGETRLRNGDIEGERRSILEGSQNEESFIRNRRNTFEENMGVIKQPLMRLVLRTTFNSDNTELAVNEFIRDPTLYETSFKLEKLDDFSVEEEVKLKHCLLLWNFLKAKLNWGDERANQEPL